MAEPTNPVTNVNKEQKPAETATNGHDAHAQSEGTAEVDTEVHPEAAKKRKNDADSDDEENV